MIESLRNIHQESDGITPYMQCPWCEYCDVIGEFTPYYHPNEVRLSDMGSGSTECGQCCAAGKTALFLLAYNPDAELYESEKFRESYLAELRIIQ